MPCRRARSAGGEFALQREDGHVGGREAEHLAEKAQLGLERGDDRLRPPEPVLLAGEEQVGVRDAPLAQRRDADGEVGLHRRRGGPPVEDDRAAALLQQLLHIHALEHSNALFASAVSYAYLVASGLKVSTSPEHIRDLARLIKDGTVGVREISDELRTWTL